MNADGIEALTFDVFGTVVDWRSSVIREMTAFGAKKGIERDWAAFARDWRSLYRPAMDRVSSGERAWTVLDTLHRESLVVLLEKYDIRGLGEAEIDHINRVWHRLDPWPDSVAGLTRLRKRFILATLSNGNVRLMVDMARHGGLPWDAILGAEVARAYKPEPACYQTTARLLGVAPEKCMMVAAHNGDLGAARRQGFATGFVSRPTEHGPGQTRDLKADSDWDVIASDFNDMADKLGC